MYLASPVHINRLAVSGNTCKAASECLLLRETAALRLCATFQVWSSMPGLTVPLGRVTKSDALLVVNKQSGWLAELRLTGQLPSVTELLALVGSSLWPVLTGEVPPQNSRNPNPHFF